MDPRAADVPPDPEPLAPQPPRKGILGFLAAIFAVYFLLGSGAQRASPSAGLAWTEVFAFLLPATAAAAGSNLRAGPFLRLSPLPPPKVAALGLLLGIAGFVASSGLHALLSTLFPESWVQAFDLTRLFEGSPRERIAIALTASVLAPLCEETAFRGYVQGSLLLSHSPGRAVALTALVFAAMHLDPIRFLPVLGLGILFGWIAWRSGSIWPAVAAHAANNGMASALAMSAAGLPAEAPDPRAGALAALVGSALVALLAAVYARATPTPPPARRGLVLRDPARPSIRFRWTGLHGSFTLLALLGLLALLAIARFGARAGG